MRHSANVLVRIIFACTAEPHRSKALKVERSRIVQRVLAGENERRRRGARGERMGDGGKLNRFGTSPDDQQHFGERQPSP